MANVDMNGAGAPSVNVNGGGGGAVGGSANFGGPPGVAPFGGGTFAGGAWGGGAYGGGGGGGGFNQPDAGSVFNEAGSNQLEDPDLDHPEFEDNEDEENQRDKDPQPGDEAWEGYTDTYYERPGYLEALHILMEHLDPIICERIRNNPYGLPMSENLKFDKNSYRKFLKEYGYPLRFDEELLKHSPPAPSDEFEWDTPGMNDQVESPEIDWEEMEKDDAGKSPVIVLAQAASSHSPAAKRPPPRKPGRCKLRPHPSLRPLFKRSIANKRGPECVGQLKEMERVKNLREQEIATLHQEITVLRERVAFDFQANLDRLENAYAPDPPPKEIMPPHKVAEIVDWIDNGNKEAFAKLNNDGKWEAFTRVLGSHDDYSMQCMEKIQRANNALNSCNAHVASLYDQLNDLTNGEADPNNIDDLATTSVLTQLRRTELALAECNVHRDKAEKQHFNCQEELKKRPLPKNEDGTDAEPPADDKKGDEADCSAQDKRIVELGQQLQDARLELLEIAEKNADQADDFATQEMERLGLNPNAPQQQQQQQPAVDAGAASPAGAPGSVAGSPAGPANVDGAAPVPVAGPAAAPAAPHTPNSNANKPCAEDQAWCFDQFGNMDPNPNRVNPGGLPIE